MLQSYYIKRSLARKVVVIIAIIQTRLDNFVCGFSLSRNDSVNFRGRIQDTNHLVISQMATVRQVTTSLFYVSEELLKTRLPSTPTENFGSNL